MALVGRDPINVHVGSRLRLIRRSHGLTQKQLSRVIGVSFQQFQKYERGLNRVGPGTLYRLAWFLGVPITFFFEDLPQDAVDSLPRAELRSDDRFAVQGGVGEGFLETSIDLAQQSLQTDPVARRLLTAYARIESRQLQIAIASFVQGVSQSGDHRSDHRSDPGPGELIE